MRKMLFYLLCLYAFFVPLEYLYVVLFSFDSPLKPYRIIFFMQMPLFMIFLFMNKRKVVKFDKIDLLLLVLFLYGFIMAFVRYYFFDEGIIGYAINDIQLILFGYLTFLILKQLELKTDEIKKILVFFFISIMINSFYIIYNAFVLHSFERLGGFFKNPNQAAEAIVMGILILLYFVGKKSFSKWWLGLLPVMLIAIFFTGSRGALIGLLIAGSYFLLQNSRRMLFRLSAAGMLILAFVLPFNAAMETLDLNKLMNRFTSENIESSGGSGRIDIWKSGLLLGKDTYFTGVGASEYRAYHHHYIRKIPDAYITVLNYDLGLHSDYMSMLVEYGFIGLLLYLYLIYFLFYRLHQIKREKELDDLPTLFILIFISMFIQGMFQVSYILPMYWLFIGLGFSLVKNRYRYSKKDLYSKGIINANS
ncbi:O-antigen ligase family protein [Sulfurovum sp. ST-21]